MPGYELLLWGEDVRMKRSINKVSDNPSTAKVGKMPNQSKTHKALKRTLRIFFPCICKKWCVVVQSLVILRLWIRWFHSGGISSFLIRLRPAPVPGRHRTVCMI